MNPVFSVLKRRYKQHKSELFPQHFVWEPHGYMPTLSPEQATALLSDHEAGLFNNNNQSKHPVRGFECNVLSSNSPIEDRRAEARLTQTGGDLFTVVDGHAGCACAQAVSERLFDYIAVSLLPFDILGRFSTSLRTNNPMELVQWHRLEGDYTNIDLQTQYRLSLQKYVVETLSTGGLEEDMTVADALRSAFVRLDNDIYTEALPIAGAMNMESYEVAFSGAVACAVHVKDLDVHVASVGDCQAVLGQYKDGDWHSKLLSFPHNAANEEEMKRLKSEHPLSEADFIVRNNRLMGQLIPLRAFGDMRYKYSVKDLNNITKLLNPSYAHNLIPVHYYTPPYLSCDPEVVHHQLEPCDKFMVLASDGLWELLSPEEVVRLVGHHLQGTKTAEIFTMPKGPVTLGKLNKMLLKRKSGLANKSVDPNVATHLMRHALGPEHHKVSEMLTLPKNVVRHYRDDITVTVVYFDTKYVLKNM